MRRTPMPVMLLSVAGLAPLLFCGLEGLTASRSWAIPALIAYAAVVLAFGGAVHWGLSLAAPASDSGPRVEWTRFVLAAVPALAGWIAVLLPLWGGLALLIAGFVLTLVGEIVADRHDLLPRRYLWLRWPLSVVAIAMLTTDLVIFLLGASVTL